MATTFPTVDFSTDVSVVQTTSTNNITETYYTTLDPSSSGGLVSEMTTDIVYWTVSCFLCGFGSIFGIVTNSINIAVYMSLGFKDTVNISLFGLAISDLLSLCPLVWVAICYNPEFQVQDLPFVPIQVSYLTGGWLHVLFVRISGWIIAFVAFERFLCIALPLKVKRILAPKTVKIIIASIFLVVIASTVPIYYANNLGWIPMPGTNRSIFGLVFTSDRDEIESVTVLFNNVISASASFFLVVIFTAALVFKLKQKAQLRSAMAAPGTTSENKSEPSKARDYRLARMMVAVSTIFIICFTPTFVNTIAIVALPEYSIAGPYRNMYSVTFAFAFLLETVNSSINIFVYYQMSSRFKERLDQMIRGKH